MAAMRLTYEATGLTLGRAMFSSVRTPRVYEHIVEQIESAIFGGKLGCGDRLPPERELVRQFHAARTAKQFDRAATEAGKVTQAAPKRADAWIYLGAAQLGAKRFKDAIAALDKGAALAPTNAQAEAYLAWAYFGLKDATSFKLHAGKAKALGHKEPTLLDYLARVEKGEPIK